MMEMCIMEMDVISSVVLSEVADLLQNKYVEMV